MVDARRSRRRRRRRGASSAAVVPAAPGPANAVAEFPRAVTVAGHRYVRTAPHTVYSMISRLEHLPRWTTLWLRSDVVDRKQGQATVHLRGYVAGLPVESTVRAVLQPSRAVEWRQVAGTLVHYGARFEFQSVEDGVLVTYTVQMEPGTVLLGEEATRLVLVQEVERTLARIKLSAEREIVAEEIRLMKAKPPAAAGPAEQMSVSTPTSVAPAETESTGEETFAQQPSKRRRRRRRRSAPKPPGTGAV